MIRAITVIAELLDEALVRLQSDGKRIHNVCPLMTGMETINKEHEVGNERLTEGKSVASVSFVITYDAPPTQEDFKQRVRSEKKALDGNRERLTAFIGGDAYRKLDPVEQSRLNRQLEAMTLYSNVLGERISAFTP